MAGSDLPTRRELEHMRRISAVMQAYLGDALWPEPYREIRTDTLKESGIPFFLVFRGDDDKLPHVYCVESDPARDPLRERIIELLPGGIKRVVTADGVVDEEALDENAAA